MHGRKLTTISYTHQYFTLQIFRPSNISPHKVTISQHAFVENNTHTAAVALLNAATAKSLNFDLAIEHFKDSLKVTHILSTSLL